MKLSQSKLAIARRKARAEETPQERASRLIHRRELMRAWLLFSKYANGIRTPESSRMIQKARVIREAEVKRWKEHAK
jgi:hypothetical protein